MIMEDLRECRLSPDSVRGGLGLSREGLSTIDSGAVLVMDELM